MAYDPYTDIQRQIAEQQRRFAEQERQRQERERQQRDAFTLYYRTQGFNAWSAVNPSVDLARPLGQQILHQLNPPLGR